jgi:hypothetical protein
VYAGTGYYRNRVTEGKPRVVVLPPVTSSPASSRSVKTPLLGVNDRWGRLTHGPRLTAPLC